MTLNPPPVETPFDKNGGAISVPWLQWVQALYTAVKNLFGSLGGSVLNIPYGSFFSVSNQTASAATKTLVSISGTIAANGVTLSTGSKITFTKAGFYSVGLTLQSANSGTTPDNVTSWLAKNGADVTNSAFISTTAAKHGSVSGFTLVTWLFVVQVAAGDYLQAYWITDSGDSSLAYTAASVSPAHPAAPSVAVTVTFVSAP